MVCCSQDTTVTVTVPTSNQVVDTNYYLEEFTRDQYGEKQVLNTTFLGSTSRTEFGSSTLEFTIKGAPQAPEIKPADRVAIFGSKQSKAQPQAEATAAPEVIATGDAAGQDIPASIRQAAADVNAVAQEFDPLAELLETADGRDELAEELAQFQPTKIAVQNPEQLQALSEILEAQGIEPSEVLILDDLQADALAEPEALAIEVGAGDRIAIIGEQTEQIAQQTEAPEAIAIEEAAELDVAESIRDAAAAANATSLEFDPLAELLATEEGRAELAEDLALFQPTIIVVQNQEQLEALSEILEAQGVEPREILVAEDLESAALVDSEPTAIAISDDFELLTMPEVPEPTATIEGATEAIDDSITITSSADIDLAATAFTFSWDEVAQLEADTAPAAITTEIAEALEIEADATPLQDAITITTAGLEETAELEADTTSIATTATISEAAPIQAAIPTATPQAIEVEAATIAPAAAIILDFPEPEALPVNSEALELVDSEATEFEDEPELALAG